MDILGKHGAAVTSPPLAILKHLLENQNCDRSIGYNNRDNVSAVLKGDSPDTHNSQISEKNEKKLCFSSN